MTTFTKEDREAVEQAAMKEQSYLLAVKTVRGSLIPWPTNVDSETWNNRVNHLLNRLCVEFGYDGENE